MVDAAGYLTDSNILLRIGRRGDADHEIVSAAIAVIRKAGSLLYFTQQNVAEFWNVSTRPTEKNGFGLSIADTERAVRSFEKAIILLPDNRDGYDEWRRLVVAHSVSGKQVHDARLVAAMIVHRVTHVLTLNTSDFARYPEITAVHPRALAGDLPRSQ
jgi:predicted nucleic acid-binding protein